jgi:hypothetical protein
LNGKSYLRTENRSLKNLTGYFSREKIEQKELSSNGKPVTEKLNGLFFTGKKSNGKPVSEKLNGLFFTGKKIVRKTGL